MFSDKDTLAKIDPKIWQVIENEKIGVRRSISS